MEENKKDNSSIKEMSFGIDINYESTPYSPHSEIHIRNSPSKENLVDAQTPKQKTVLDNSKNRIESNNILVIVDIKLPNNQLLDKPNKYYI